MISKIFGKAVIENELLADALIVIKDSKILFAGSRQNAPEFEAGDELSHEGLIFPGLVDIHNHGGGGWSFPDTLEPEQAYPAIEEHLKHGTTSLVASLVTADQETLLSRVRALAELTKRGDLAGIHLEGPFISKERKGAQDPKYIAPAEVSRTKELLEAGAGAIVTMTIAPEQDPNFQVSEVLISHGALPSYGHTDCTGDLMINAVASANKFITKTHQPLSAHPTATHLFNGMRPIHHRDAGPAFAAIDSSARGQLVSELIADGVHTAADTVKYTFDLIPDGYIMLITDAMAAAGMPDGSYVLGSLSVTVKDGVATLTEGGAIAGGTAHLLDVVRFTHFKAGVDLVRAVNAATATPAKVLGRGEEIGVLKAGAKADILLVDDELKPVKVMKSGSWLY